MQTFRSHLFLVAVTLTVAGCDDGPPAPPPLKQVGDTSISCALDGASKFEPVCKLVPGPGGFLTIRHPDGGFRRLQIYDKHVSTADGSERATMAEVEGQTIVTVGKDRYAFQGSGPVTP